TTREMSWSDVAGELDVQKNDITQLQKARYGTSIQLAMRAARWVERSATSFMWEHDGRGLPWSGRRV
ncbi:MAG: hypothetical protein QOD30_1211, partial [Actinomycetota bacterium]|nr:hypothetical protein [Actinomycetota bacterium]